MKTYKHEAPNGEIVFRHEDDYSGDLTIERTTLNGSSVMIYMPMAALIGFLSEMVKSGACNPGDHLPHPDYEEEQHETYDRQAWRNAVANDETLLGYHDWVVATLSDPYADPADEEEEPQSSYKRTPFNDLVAKAISRDGLYEMKIDDAPFIIVWRDRDKVYSGHFDVAHAKSRDHRGRWEGPEPYGVVCDAAESNGTGAPYSTEPVVESD